MSIADFSFDDKTRRHCAFFSVICRNGRLSQFDKIGPWTVGVAAGNCEEERRFGVDGSIVPVVNAHERVLEHIGYGAIINNLYM